MKRILITGRGGAGSWTIRAEQIGSALGALVKPMATVEDIRAADFVLVVKRVPEQLLAALRAARRPWAYDVVDAYPQPGCTFWSRQQAAAWMRDAIRRVAPDLIIWPNRRMRDDCSMQGPAIYHHFRPGIDRNPIRQDLKIIGYEGRPHYLQGWHNAIDRECTERGMTFVLNPGRLADVDAILAVRGGDWRGYVQDHWKSNVKLANAHGSGTPFIGIRECGYIETAAGGEEWVDRPKELGRALDRLADQKHRQEVQAAFLKAAIPLSKTAEQTREALCALKS